MTMWVKNKWEKIDSTHTRTIFHDMRLTSLLALILCKWHAHTHIRDNPIFISRNFCYWTYLINWCHRTWNFFDIYVQYCAVQYCDFDYDTVQNFLDDLVTETIFLCIVYCYRNGNSLSLLYASNICMSEYRCECMGFCCTLLFAFSIFIKRNETMWKCFAHWISVTCVNVKWQFFFCSLFFYRYQQQK